MKLAVTITPPFDSAALFERLAFTGSKSSLLCAETAERRMTRAIRVNGRTVPISLVFEGTVDSPEAALELPDETDRETAVEALSFARRMISADTDLTSFYARFAGDKQLSGLCGALRGCKMLLDPDPFECLIKTIISQQLNLAFAGTLTERLVRLAGGAVEFRNQPILVFPDAEAIARLSYNQLRELSFSQRKAEYVIDTARQIVQGTLDLEVAGRWSDEETIAELTRLRGIGRWTVECLLMFAWGRPDLLPAADIGLRNGIRRVYALNRQPTAEEVAKLGAAWRPWRTYATFYLWESLRLPIYPLRSS